MPPRESRSGHGGGVVVFCAVLGEADRREAASEVKAILDLNFAIAASHEKQKDLVGRSESGYKEIAAKQTL